MQRISIVSTPAARKDMESGTQPTPPIRIAGKKNQGEDPSILACLRWSQLFENRQIRIAPQVLHPFSLTMQKKHISHAEADMAYFVAERVPVAVDCQRCQAIALPEVHFFERPINQIGLRH